jgi:hypothetical protein
LLKRNCYVEILISFTSLFILYMLYINFRNILFCINVDTDYYIIV